MKLIKKTAEHPISVLMIYTGIMLFGVVSLFRINIELLPKISIPVARVITEYSSMPAPEVEQLVTVPLENALSSVKGVKDIQSITKQGIMSISLRFDWGASMENAAVEIREKIDSAYPFLPYGIKKPLVFTEDISDVPIMTLAVFPASNRTFNQIHDTVKKELKTRLLQIKGVSDIKIIGLTEPELIVDVDGQKLTVAKIPLSAVIQTIASSVFEYPAGKMKEGNLEYLVKAGTKITTPGDIRNLPLILNKGGTGLHISDVADVYFGEKEKTSFFHMNGKEAVGILINKTGNMGSLNAANNILKELLEIKNSFKNDLHIEVIEDGSGEIRLSIRSLLISIGLGISAALVVLFLLFKEGITPVITIISIPISMASVFLFMFITHISLNVISLAGIAIGIGMIVDNSIVVLENLKKKSAQTSDEIHAATIEMGSSTFASTVTTLLVFVPVLFIPGITGALFKELAITISFLLLTSFIVSMTLTPALYVLFNKRGHKTKSLKSRRSSSILSLYEKYLKTMITKPFFSLFLFIFTSALGVFFFTLLPKEILPEVDKGKIEGTIILNKGTDIERSSALTGHIEQEILNLKDIQSLYSEAGYDVNSLKDRAAKARDLNIVRINVLLKQKRDAGVNTLMAQLSRLLTETGNYTFTLKLPDDTIKKLLDVKGESIFIISGKNRENIIRRARILAEETNNSGLTQNFEMDTGKNTPEILLHLHSESLAYSAITPLIVLRTLSASIKGEVPAKLNYQDEEYDIRVKIKEKQTDTKEKILELQVPSPQGFVSIKSLGTLKDDYTYGELYRRGRKSTIEIRFFPKHGMRQKLNDFLSAKIFKAHNMEGTFLAQSALQSSLKEIAIAFVLAVFLMYLIMGAQFESFSIPLLLLISLPLSVSGSFLLLFIMNKSLNINSFLGILILLGITINTSIILTVSFNKGTKKEIIAGSLGRMKPIFATVCTTIAALIPIGFNPMREAELQSHTALSVIGGLITGTLATILIYPSIYYLFKGKRTGK